MSDNPESAGNGGQGSSRKLESLREDWRKRARNNHRIAGRYTLYIIILFFGAGAIVGLAETIIEKTLSVAAGATVEGLERLEERLEEQLEKRLTLPRRFDFRGVALGRRDGTVFAVGDDGFILAADSGSSLREWESLPSNTGKNFHGIAVSDDGVVVIAVGRRGLVRRSVDGGKTWTDPGGVTPQDVNGVALSGDGETAILVGDDGLVRRSDTGGETWDPVTVETGEGRPKDINAVALSGDGRIAVLVGDRGLVRHSDTGGRTWRDPGIVTTEQGRREDINAVALSRDGKIAVFVGDRGLAGTLRMAARSGKSASLTWKPCATNVGDDLNGVALSSDGKTAVAAGDDGRVLVFDIDVQKGGCSGVRGGNVGTPHRLHAVVLDEDPSEGVVAIVAGRNRTIVRSDVSLSRIEIETVEQVRVPLTEEERRAEEERRVEEAKKARDNVLSDDALSDRIRWVFLYSTALRVGIIGILMFWVRHLVGLTRYHLRLAAYYDARGDVIALVGEGLSSKPPDGLSYLERAIDALSPDDIGFSDTKVRHKKLLTLPRAAKDS